MESEKLYIVYCQRETEEPFYIPHQDVWRIFRSKEKAIQTARDLRNYSKSVGGNNNEPIYYVKEYTYDDDKVYFNREIINTIDENKSIYPNETNLLSHFNIVYLLGDIEKMEGLMKI